MMEIERAELAVAYDAVMAMMDLTEGASFRFRVGIIGEERWMRLLRSGSSAELGGRLGIESFELARCSSDLARGVLTRVLGIAQTPAFHGRCLNRDTDPTQPGAAESRCVIYLVTFRDDRSSSRSAWSEDRQQVSRAVSGLLSRVRPTKSA